MDQYGNYQIIGFLGEGGCSTIFKVRKEGQPNTYALKIFNAFGQDYQNAVATMNHQYQMMNDLNDVNDDLFIKVFEKYDKQKLDCSLSQSNQQVFPGIVMEYLSADNLHVFRHGNIKKFSRQLALVYTKLLLEGLKIMHQNDIYHLDIKLENLLLREDGMLKISDFGTTVEVERLKHKVGTQQYQPPQFEKQQVDCSAQKVDIYHAGLCYLSLLLNMSAKQVCLQLKYFKESNKGFWQQIDDEELRNFGLKMCHHDPEKRKSAKELLEQPLMNNLQTEKCKEIYENKFKDWSEKHGKELQKHGRTRSAEEPKTKEQLQRIREQFGKPLQSTKGRCLLYLDKKPEQILLCLEDIFAKEGDFIIDPKEQRTVSIKTGGAEIQVVFDVSGKQHSETYSVKLYIAVEKQIKVEILNQQQQIDAQCKIIAHHLRTAIQ